MSYELGDAFDNELLMPLATNYFINQKSWKLSAPPIAGRGAAMAATASRTTSAWPTVISSVTALSW